MLIKKHTWQKPVEWTHTETMLNQYLSAIGRGRLQAHEKSHLGDSTGSDFRQASSRQLALMSTIMLFYALLLSFI